MAMGLTFLRLQVGNPARPDVLESIEFLVDSGATFTVVPAPILKRLGIKPIARQEFQLADGTRIVRRRGIALFRYGDHVGGAGVIFGDREDSTLLGVSALEALGLALDPLRRRLVPLPMILGAAAAA